MGRAGWGTRIPNPWDVIKKKLETEGAKNKAYDSDVDGVIDLVATPYTSRPVPYSRKILLKPITFDPTTGTRIREATADADGYWVGAPYVFYDYGTGEFWMVYRWRDPDNRGYKITIAKSTDGINFTDVKSITKGDLGFNSIEKASLIRDPVSGKYKFYCCGDDGTGWDIYKLDDVDDPADLDPATKTKVVARGASSEWDDVYVKDPHVFYIGGYYFMLYAGRGDSYEKGGIAMSKDGDSWTKYADNPIIDTGAASSWDAGIAKPTTVVMLGGVWCIYYNGLPSLAATSPDQAQGLVVWVNPLSGTPVKLTDTAPLFGTKTKYLDIVIVEDTIYCYYEYMNPDESEDLFVKTISVKEVL